jgi:hypothetical protein
MLRNTVAVIVALTFGLGVAAAALAQYSQPGPRPEATKPPAPAQTGEAKKPTEKPKTVAGTAKSVDAAKEYGFALAGATIKAEGKEATSTDLKGGDAVRVTYTELEGKLVAKTVVAKAAKAKK